MGALVFAASFCVYAWTAGAAVGWLDTPEISAASASLGIAHSPGHPLPALLGRLLDLLPFGDLHLRASLASGLAGAAAAWATWRAGREAVALVAPDLDGGARDRIAAAAALVFALCGAAWIPATRAEVYALQTLLCAGALAGALHWERTGAARGLLAACLCAGLALANHPLIALAALAPLAVFVLFTVHPERSAAAGGAKSKGRPRPAVIGCGALLLALGLASLLYLPVRAAAHPEVSWGAPETADRFLWTVSGRAFHKSVGAGGEDTGRDAAELAATLAVDVGPILLPLALLGLYLGLRRPGWRRAALALAGVAVTTAAGRALVGFHPETPDDRAYLAPASLALVLLGAGGVAALIAAIAAARPALAGRATMAATVAVIVAVPVQPLLHAEAASQRGADRSDVIAAWELERLPPRALLLVSHFETSFRGSAKRALEGTRPDVTVLDLGFLTYPGMAGEARWRHPELVALIDAPLRLGARMPIDRLRASGRPVLVQLQPELDRPALAQLLPSGPFALLAPAPPTIAERAAAERADVVARAALGARLADPPAADRRGARDALLWFDVNRLRFYCSAVRPSAWAPPPDGLLGADCRLAVPPE